METSSAAAADAILSPTRTQNSTPPTLSKSPERERSLADIISEQFPPFDTQALVIQPFEDEAAADLKFEKDLSDMLLKAILETHAWAAARPKHEATLESQKLEDEVSQIMETEREQGTSRSPAPSVSSSSSFLRFRIFEETRAKLGDFVRRMKMALAALTDTDL